MDSINKRAVLSRSTVAWNNVRNCAVRLSRRMEGSTGIENHIPPRNTTRKPTKGCSERPSTRRLLNPDSAQQLRNIISEVERAIFDAQETGRASFVAPPYAPNRNLPSMFHALSLGPKSTLDIDGTSVKMDLLPLTQDRVQEIPCLQYQHDTKYRIEEGDGQHVSEVSSLQERSHLQAPIVHKSLTYEPPGCVSTNFWDYIDSQGENLHLGNEDSMSKARSWESSESMWVSGFSEDSVQSGQEDPLYTLKYGCLLYILVNFNEAKGQESHNGSQCHNGIPAPSQGQTKCGRQGHESKRARKRARSSDSTSSCEDERKGRHESNQHRRLFLACPFAKKDPVRHRKCYSYTLNRIGDVKQHISRRHRIPLYCPRCMETFDDDDCKDIHIRSMGCQ
ncbi:hypothetical protein F5Y15DRAFT_58633 [Xylariaceae sp. FL0016]|nr:hypothetical protein F5Y15DRAFT_58633 [Xylariaceae sp. FL0016]